MSSSPLVEMNGAAKRYRQFRRPAHRLMDLLGWTNPHQAPIQVNALEPINLTLEPGEALGVVGLNGAGKSTLLQLMAGTLEPSEGMVRRRGRVAALLELGSGFEPEFTGRENILFNAAALGLSQSEIEARIDEIIAFAGIGAQIDHPIKTYSSGMVVRLAFSVATSVVPDILIIDEALSVGDGAFARKSFDRVMSIKRSGAAVVFCSHTLFHIEVFCDRAIWLHQGRVQASGPTSSVLSSYQAFLDDLSRPQSDQALHRSLPAAPEGAVRLVSAQVTSLDGKPCDVLEAGHVSLEVFIEFAVQGAVPRPTAAIVISTEAGRILATSFSPGSGGITTAVSSASEGGRFHARLIDIPLNKGRYRLGVYLLCEHAQHVYEWVDPIADFEVQHSGLDQGFLRLQADWLD